MTTVDVRVTPMTVLPAASRSGGADTGTMLISFTVSIELRKVIASWPPSPSRRQRKLPSWSPPFG